MLAFDQWLHVQLAQLHGWEVYFLAVLAFSGLYFGSAGLMQGLIRWAQRQQVGAVVTPSLPRSGQVREEIRHSLLSIQVFALQGVGLWWLLQHGYLSAAPLTSTTAWVLQVVVLFAFNEVHFYLAHRGLHHPWWLRRVHGVHHRSRIPTPYATYAFHWGEAAVLGSVMPLALLVYPFALSSLLVLPLLSIVINVQGHCNYTLFPGARRGALRGYVQHHQAHHEKLRGNFGFALPWLDQWLGTALR